MLIRHITLWPWPLTRWPWKSVVWCHVVIVCSKFDRNRTIPGWVIDNLANFGPHYVTLWPWLLTLWPWTCVVDQVSCAQKGVKNVKWPITVCTVVRDWWKVVRISVGNDTFRGAAPRKPLTHWHKCGRDDYVDDTTQYPKRHVNRFSGRDPHEGVKC